MVGLQLVFIDLKFPDGRHKLYRVVDKGMKYTIDRSGLSVAESFSQVHPLIFSH